MNTSKIFGISQTEPLQILKISVEQEFGSPNVDIALDSITVIGVQGTTTVINPALPNETKTEIDYLTPNGIFENSFTSGVGIAENEDDLYSMEFNFIGPRGGQTASLIVPKISYPKTQSTNNKYLQRVIDNFTKDGLSIEHTKEKIYSDINDIFLEMVAESSRGVA